MTYVRPHIIDRLRESTSDLHHALEHTFHAEAIASGNITRAQYEEVLSLFLGFHRPVEKVIEELHLESFLPDIAERMRTKQLYNDLKKLGFSQAQIDELPDCPSIPCPKTVEQALGVLYVLEGSTLGGRVILKMLASHIENNVIPAEATTYYAGHGDNTGTFWKDFTMSCGHILQTENQQQQAIDFAKQTFLLLYQWMEKTT